MYRVPGRIKKLVVPPDSSDDDNFYGNDDDRDWSPNQTNSQECVISRYQSNIYSVQNNPDKPLSTNIKEIEQFIGICIYMSIYGLPRSRMYWINNTQVEKVADVMSRRQWEELKKTLHFNGNSELPTQCDGNKDKLFKIHPLYEALCSNIKISLKQYNPKKPNKWGYKILFFADSNGLIKNMEIYSGKTEHVPNLPNLGASTDVVLRLSENLPRNQTYLLYFDNWFSSPGLCVTLAKLGIYALSTVRINRYPGLSFSWHDNRCVVLCSSFESAQPVSSAKKYDSRDKVRIDISCPRAVTSYNQFMGVVDQIYALIHIIAFVSTPKNTTCVSFFTSLTLSLSMGDCCTDGAVTLNTFTVTIVWIFCGSGRLLPKYSAKK
ncbi:hypothetical protein PR048_026827, partial [Dryococelus australis]